MRHSVEHFGPQHQVRDIVVADGVIMRICPEFEFRRFEFMHPILKVFGRSFRKNPFEYDLYPAFDLGGRCYDNAMKLIAIDPSLIYCEGVLLPRVNGRPSVPMPHAWCLSQDGALVDPTAHKIQHHPDILYVGIPFNNDYAWAWFKKFGFHGMLDGHPELGDQVGVYKDSYALWLHERLGAIRLPFSSI